MFAARILGQQRAAAGPLLRPSAGLLQRGSNLQGAQEVQTRNAATLKALSIRMRSIKNMQKITKAMKMVATAKFKKDMALKEEGAPFGEPVKKLFARLGAEEKPGAVTFLAVTSDKGLCGGVNSAVGKIIRNSLADEEAKGNATKVMVMGGKGVATMKRRFGDRFSYSFEELSKVPWSFTSASIIADRLVATNPTRCKIVSNEFKSMVAYDTVAAHTITLDEAQTMDKSEWSKAMDVYSFEPALYEVWDDLHEFYYGCAIFTAYLQSAATETAQRMSAMENASKNAGEMYDKVSLMFNRARQAKITTELCEIISGASAV
jgi:F-type H+-transporting ATPase subunit gamma